MKSELKKKERSNINISAVWVMKKFWYFHFIWMNDLTVGPLLLLSLHT